MWRGDPAGPERDPHRDPPGAAAGAPALARLHQNHRGRPGNRPTDLRQRQALAQWRDGTALTAAGMLEAQKTFRRLKAYRQLSILRKALQDHHRKVQANSTIETITKAA